MNNNEISPTVRAEMAITAEELAEMKAKAERGSVLVHGREWRKCGSDLMELRLIADLERTRGFIENFIGEAADEDCDPDKVGPKSGAAFSELFQRYVDENYDLRERAERAEAALAEKDAELDGLRLDNRIDEQTNFDHVAQLRYRAESAEAALAEKDSEIARIRSSYDRREGIVADRETTIANQQAEIARLQAEAAHHRATFEHLRDLLPKFGPMDGRVWIPIDKALSSNAGKAMLERMEKLQDERDGFQGASIMMRLEITDLENAADALRELVELKDIKDSLEGELPGSDSEQEYRERKPHAWDAAREALAVLDGKEGE